MHCFVPPVNCLLHLLDNSWLLLVFNTLKQTYIFGISD